MPDPVRSQESRARELPELRPGMHVNVRHIHDMFPATVVEIRNGRVRVNIWVEGTDEPLVGVYRLEDFVYEIA